MKISIITASYNYAQYIEEAINSVINQSYSDWELIIVDDGSSDNSLEIIKSYCEKDERIKLFFHEADCEQRLKGKTTFFPEMPFSASNQERINKGLKETLLLGIENATGDWVAFLESDDFFETDNLAEKVKVIEKHSNVKLIFNKVKFLSETKRKEQKIFEKTQKKLSKMCFPKNMFKDFYTNNMILTFSCVMVEANILKNADFITPVDSLLDWWLWIHLAYKNNFYYINEELTSWRLHDKSYIEKTKRFSCLLPIKAYWEIFKQNKSLEFLFFIVYSSVIFIFVRVFRFLNSLGRSH